MTACLSTQRGALRSRRSAPRVPVANAPAMDMTEKTRSSAKATVQKKSNPGRACTSTSAHEALMRTRERGERGEDAVEAEADAAEGVAGVVHGGRGSCRTHRRESRRVGRSEEEGEGNGGGGVISARRRRGCYRTRGRRGDDDARHADGPGNEASRRPRHLHQERQVRRTSPTARRPGAAPGVRTSASVPAHKATSVLRSAGRSESQMIYS